MPTESPRSAPPSTSVKWSAPYVTASQLCAAGLASPTTLDTAQKRGTLVPVGRRGGAGVRVYTVESVERWLRGETATVAPSTPRTLPPRRTSASTEGDALSRIAATARGGSR